MRKLYNIKIAGKRYEVEIESVKELEENTEKTEVIANKEENNSSISSNDEILRAPLQGLVLDILVKEGDSFKKGDKLLLIEAMKMENEILAPRDGKVRKINVNKDQSVNSGDALLTYI